MVDEERGSVPQVARGTNRPPDLQAASSHERAGGGNNKHPGVPRWPAALALLAVGGIYLLVSDQLSIGPRWLLLTLAVGLLIPLTVVRLRGRHRLTRWLALAAVVSATLAVALSAAFLLIRLPGQGVPPRALLRDAALIWLANVMTFALWYWELDGGGPARRHPGRHASSDFAFPQQQQDDDGLVEGWSPGFIDYLFLAFNTSTALSPTDTLVLSRRMKALMMLQALISLVTIAVIAARAVNTL